MEDQHKSVLDKFYEESIKRAKRHLEKKYSVTVINKGEDDFPNIVQSENYVFLRAQIANDDLPLTLIIAIPKHFPDSLPKIYLSKEDYSKLAPIPHVDKNRFVCTKDPNIAFLNDKKPEEAVDELIHVAIDIIKKGIKKENIKNFTEEFLAYWNDQAETKFLSLWVPSSKIEIVKIIKFVRNLALFKYLIARSVEEAKNWVASIKIQIDEDRVYEALHLPLSNPFDVPLPQNNHDIYKLIKNSRGKNYIALEKFLNENNSNRTIIVSFQLGDDRILAGWIFAPWEKEIYDGFRRNKVPLEIRLQRTALIPIEKINIEKADPDRLFGRGGLGVRQSLKNASIAIIGCGSLGSHLAISLSKSGISKFLLVDNDILEPANVARHVCGFYEAIRHCYKSEAVKNRLLEHFPHINCFSSKEDILDLLEKDESVLNEHNLSVVAIGDKAVERRLSYLLKKGIIKLPLIFIWLEPYGVAGHFLYIHPRKGGCFQCCFNSEGIFEYSVAKYNKDLFKRESGCQSTFVPYSNLEIDIFVNVATREIIHCLEEKRDQSFLLTWLGDLRLFKSLGYEINDRWIADFNYTVHKKIILKNKYCESCGIL
jgi:molybdopterin/thiamine biosynthesis adenylyltransferase